MNNCCKHGNWPLQYQLDVRVKCDASLSGLGAAIEQNTSDGWKPTAFAPRVLNSTEERYSVNELELLVFVWSIEYFNLYGKISLLYQILELYYKS